jgi:chromosome segregation ATPase
VGNEAVAGRFEESALQGPTAVESAIELSEKYAKLSEEAAVIRQQNNDLITENRRLEEQVTALEADLLQAQKELTEANNLLREMIVELNSWKADVIGFREEMRSAEKAQLEALLKILQILGGEVDLEQRQDEQQGQSEVSAGAPDQSQSQKVSSEGERNE